MKGSLRIGKGSAKHNSHTFTADHINEEKKKENIYWTWEKGNNATAHDLEVDELAFYEKNYSEYLNGQNEKYKQKRQYKRIKTMQEYYKTNAPDEMILQIGKMGETVDPELFHTVVNEWLNDFKERYGTNIHVLSYAVHNDEATPHIHLRVSYDYIDNNIKRFGINKALAELGFQSPKQGKEDRYNNKKISFTDQIRQTFYDFCELFGIEINRTVENPSHKYLEAQLYKAVKLQEENERNKEEYKAQIEELEKQIKKLENEKEQAHEYYNDKRMTFQEVKADIDKNCNEAIENYKKEKAEQLEKDKEFVNQDFDNELTQYKMKVAHDFVEAKHKVKDDFRQQLSDLGLSGHDVVNINDFVRE